MYIYVQLPSVEKQNVSYCSYMYIHVHVHVYMYIKFNNASWTLKPQEKNTTVICIHTVYDIGTHVICIYMFTGTCYLYIIHHDVHVHVCV